MNSALADKKQTAPASKDQKSSHRRESTRCPIEIKRQSSENTTESLRDSLAKIDIERASVIKDAIENLKPGKRFDSTVSSATSTSWKRKRIV